MDQREILDRLERLDAALEFPVRLCIFGSGAFILLGEPDRTSLDLDVAAPYSEASFPDLEKAAERIGLPVNPPADYEGEHIEWVGPLRLCLARPDPAGEVPLWTGRRLAIVTVPPADLAASKLVRCDETDLADLRFLCSQARLRWEDIARAAERLPDPFRNDPVVRDNLAALKREFEP
jgi:hypothetical protein